MYFDNAEGMVFRPPSEADSLIIRVTIGCSHNACTFCAMYKNVTYRERSMEEIESLIVQAQRYYGDSRRIFLADGNALSLPTDTLLALLNKFYKSFPRLTRVGCYAGPKDVLRKTPEELSALYQAGLKIAYLGIESGDPEILRAICKGVTPGEMIEAGQRMLHAGIKLSATVILGIGGREHTLQHAENTAKVINAIQPTMLSMLSLMVYPDTPLGRKIAAGSFTPLSTEEILAEQYRLLEAIDVTKPCIFRSNHASNYLPLAGTLPKDKPQLLHTVKQIMEKAPIPKHRNFRE
jgi:radical SAM superfamily enzyme YgiQ (UPF0313 family)